MAGGRERRVRWESVSEGFLGYDVKQKVVVEFPWMVRTLGE